MKQTTKYITIVDARTYTHRRRLFTVTKIYSASDGLNEDKSFFVLCNLELTFVPSSMRQKKKNAENRIHSTRLFYLPPLLSFSLALSVLVCKCVLQFYVSKISSAFLIVKHVRSAFLVFIEWRNIFLGVLNVSVRTIEKGNSQSYCQNRQDKENETNRRQEKPNEKKMHTATVHGCSAEMDGRRMFKCDAKSECRLKLDYLRFVLFALFS